MKIATKIRLKALFEPCTNPSADGLKKARSKLGRVKGKVPEYSENSFNQKIRKSEALKR